MAWTGKCDQCDTKLKHNEQHDAYYCPACNEWRERKCKDKDCGYCAERPERPQ